MNFELAFKTGNVEGLHAMTWRFLVMGDRTIEKFAIRDLDSSLTSRERAAVDEWENSNYPLHGMRDHPSHKLKILGGMWGGDNRKLGWKLAREIQKSLLTVRPAKTG